jgi:hypothetical protein
VYSDQEWDAGEDILYGAIKKLFGPWVDEREEETAYEVQKISVQCPDVQKLYATLDERFLQKHFQPFSNTSCERYPMEMFIEVTGDGLRFEFHELMGSCGIELFETLIGLRKKSMNLQHCWLLIQRRKKRMAKYTVQFDDNFVQGIPHCSVTVTSPEEWLAPEKITFDQFIAKL